MSDYIKKELLNEIESEVLASINDISGSSSKEEKQTYFRKRRDLILQKNIRYISDNIGLLKKNTGDGRSIDISRIEPYLEIVNNPEQLRTFRLFRFLSTYPFSEQAGRRIKFFIRDRNHQNKPIMGIGCLSSPVINLGVRDRYIGWGSNDPFKYKRLKNVVELSCAVAIPPYNLLCTGKLIALVALSSELVQYYGEKYNDVNSYVLVLGTGLYGKNCTLFNRLKLEGEQAYEYLGNTRGFTHIHISPMLYEKIEKLANISRLHFYKGSQFFTNRRLKNIESVFYQMKTPYRKLLILPLTKAVFAASTAPNFVDYLLGKQEKAIHKTHGVESLVSSWKSRWMEMRMNKPEIAAAIRNFSLDMHYRTLGFSKSTTALPFPGGRR